MRAGDLVFVRGQSFISKTIQLFDKGRFSHVAICVSKTEVLEAQSFTRSRIVPFYFQDYEIVDLGLTDKQRQQVIDLAPTLVGKWYDYFQIVGFLLHGNWNNPKQLICSELVAIMLTEIGRLKDSEKVRNLTPNQLYKLLTEKGE